eukprot:s5962_g5.t1
MLGAEVTAEEWKKECELEDLDSWDWYVVGNPNCEKVKEKTRGGIIPLSDAVLMNLLLHAYGVQADATGFKFTKKVDGTVSCDAFPGEKFDCVVSCTGYKGSSKLLPHCINATTPISDTHMHQSWMMTRKWQAGMRLQATGQSISGTNGMLMSASGAQGTPRMSLLKRGWS